MYLIQESNFSNFDSMLDNLYRLITYTPKLVRVIHLWTFLNSISIVNTLFKLIQSLIETIIIFHIRLRQPTNVKLCDYILKNQERYKIIR